MNEEQEAPYGWVVVGATFVALAVIFGVSYSFAAFFEPLSQAFNANRADVSLVFGLSGLLYFLLGAGAGMLADRFGPRAVTSAGMVLIALALAAVSVADSLLQVTLFYGLGVGAGIALVYTPAIACVQPWFTRQRGLAAGLASSGVGAGTLVVPVLMSWALNSMDWRHALQWLAASTLVLGLSATVLLRRAPAATARAGVVVPGLTLREAIAHPQFRWMYAATLLGAVPMFIPFAHVSAAARDLGVGDARAVGLVGLIGIGSLVGRFAIGTVADRVGRPLTLVLAQAALGLSYLLWAGAGGYAALAIFAVVMGLSYGGIVSLLPALCMDFFGARAVSSILGTLYSGAAFGNLAGPYLAGAVFDHSGSYLGVTWGCLALSIGATWCSVRATKPARVRR